MNLDPDNCRLRRIFVDMSHTADSGYNTGIQRVVRKLAGILPKVSSAKRIECYPVVWRDGIFRIHLTENTQPLDLRSLKQNFTQRLPKSYQSIISRVCRTPGLRFLQNQLLPSPGHLGVFSLPVRAYFGVSQSISKRVNDREPIEFGPGDCLVLPDGYWVMMDIWPAIEAAKAQGALIHTIVYDLICMTHPQFFGPGASECFEKYLIKVLQTSDLVTGISQTVRNQIRERSIGWQADGRLDATQIAPAIESIELGAEILKRRGHVSEKISDLFSDEENQPYLMVSTFEPRKNHRVVLEAAEILLDRNQSIRLVFAGRVGWMCDETLELIARLHSKGIDIKVFHDLSDDDIDFCYENAKAVIYPSFVEGFGLPIVEALWHGRTTFASDTPIHREVGQEDCIYFDPNRAMDLAMQIQRFEQNIAFSSSKAERQVGRRAIKSWTDCAEQVLHRLLITFQVRRKNLKRKLVDVG